MAEIRLRDYAVKIKELIRLGQHDEAIAHCQHILRHYPRHVETYCLLGEACLEKEMVREAIEFFQRTLSADPENLIARMGLGIVFGQQGAILEAIWQVERAFELAPGNTEVRRELQRLYAQRDGVEKTKLQLTHGALGRLYSRNGLYEQAVSEFRGILEQDRDLPDIQLALIEALWREGRRLEAVDVCLDLLKGLPNCLKANLILGEIWSQGGHEDAAAEKLEAARALDPENLMAQELFGKDSPLPPEEVRIAELEPSATYLRSLRLATDQERAVTMWGTEWAGPGAQQGGPDAGRGSGSEVPDWLRETDVVAGEEEGEALPSEWPAEQEPGEDIPAWLQDLMGEEAEAGPVPGAELPPGDGEGQPELPALPPWLEELESAERGELAAVAPGDEPWWEEPAGTEAEGAAGPEGEDSAELPEWLQELGVPKRDVVLADEGLPGPGEPEDLPEWLQDLRAEQEDATAPLAELQAREGTASLEEVPPDGERDVQAAEDLPAAVAEAAPEVPTAEEAEELPGWLRDLGLEAPAGTREEAGETAVVEVPAGEAEPQKAEVESAAGEGLPGWLAAIGVGVAARELREERIPGEEPDEAEGAVAALPVEAEIEAPVPEAQVPASLRALVAAGILAEEDVAEAMAQMSPEELDEQRAEAVPEWLQDLLVEGEAAEPAPAPEDHVEEGLPAWHQDLSAPEAEVPAPEVAEEEIPAWLRDVGAPEAEVPAPEVEEGGEEEPPAWLQDVGMPEGEVPVTEVAEEELPAWLQDFAEAEPALPGAEAEETVEVPVTEEVHDWLEALREPEAEVSAPLYEEAVEARVVEEVSDWLGPAGEQEVEVVAPELEAEAEVAIAEEAVAPTVPPAEPAVEGAPPAAAPAGVEAAAAEAAPAAALKLQELRAELQSSPRNHRLRLEVARLSASQQEWNAALGHYEKLIATRKFVPDVVQDLQRLAEEDVDRSRVYQLLGDAFVQEDQLDRALDMYRQARQALLKR